MSLRYFRHGDGAEALKTGANMGLRPSRTVHDKPVLHPTRQAFVAARGEPSISTKVREEKQAVDKLLVHDTSNPLVLSAFGVGVFSLVTLLGIHLRRGLQPAIILASSGGPGTDTTINTPYALGDNIMEMKTQSSSIIHSTAAFETRPAHTANFSRFGWEQLSSQNSRPCTAIAAKRSSRPPLAAKRSSTNGVAAPRRITSETVKSSGRSIKRQLSLVRAVNNAAAPPKKSIEKKRVGRKPKSEPKNNIVQLLYERSLLLVDGYNVIFGTEKLKEMSEKSMDQARESLVMGCESVANSRGWDVAVVFDAPQTDEDRVEDHRSPRVSVVFTNRMETADAYIEKAAEERRDLGDGATLVATNDSMIRLMASARKAGTMNVDALMETIEGSEKAMAARLKAGREANKLQRGDYDFLEDLALAVRHTDSAIEAKNVQRAQQYSDHRQLLDRIAADRSPADIERLASIEKHMPDAERTRFDMDKRLLGLLDLLGTAWWAEENREGRDRRTERGEGSKEREESRKER